MKKEREEKEVFFPLCILYARQACKIEIERQERDSTRKKEERGPLPSPLSLSLWLSALHNNPHQSHPQTRMGKRGGGGRSSSYSSSRFHRKSRGKHWLKALPSSSSFPPSPLPCGCERHRIPGIMRVYQDPPLPIISISFSSNAENRLFRRRKS